MMQEVKRIVRNIRNKYYRPLITLSKELTEQEIVEFKRQWEVAVGYLEGIIITPTESTVEYICIHTEQDEHKCRKEAKRYIQKRKICWNNLVI